MPGVRELRSHCRRSGQPLRGKFFPDERKVLPTKEAKHPVRSGVVEDVVRNAREPSSLGLSYATLKLGVPRAVRGHKRLKFVSPGADLDQSSAQLLKGLDFVVPPTAAPALNIDLH